LMGVYYKDQIDIHLVRRLAGLAHLERVGDTRGVARRRTAITSPQRVARPRSCQAPL
jgi:hypothetical protein